MIEFLRRLWDLTRPYRGRLLLAILTGVVGGLLELATIATIVFVYGLIFPSADAASSLLTKKSFKDATGLVTKLSHQSDAVSHFVWGHFSEYDQRVVIAGIAASNKPPALLIEHLNHLLQCESIYEPQRFAGVKLAPETRLLLEQNPQGEALIHLNRVLLDDAFPAELFSITASPLAARMWWAPGFVRDWALSAQQALILGVKSHPGAIMALVALIPGVIMLRGLFSYLNVYLLQWVSIRSITDLRNRLFEHIMNLEAGFFSRTSTGELMARIMNDTGTLQGIISNATTVIVKDPVTLVSLLCYVLVKETKLTLLSLVVMPVCMVPIVVYGKKVRRSSRALQTHAAELTGVMAETFTGNRVIRAYNLETTVVEQFKTTAKKFIGHYMRIVRSMEIPGPLLEFFGAVGLALLLIYLIVHRGERPSSADFLAVILSIFSMYRPLKNLTRLHNTLEQGRAASEKVFALLATKSTIPEPSQPKTLRAAGAEVSFDCVDFSYGDKLVLQDISLTVAPGHLVALVGASGSGKTTVTNLLLRFYDPSRGAIRIGGTDLREVTTSDLRKQIAVVTQETILFNQTIARNIELGRPGATQKEIVEAARHANAYDFIMRKPKGFETVVGEKGVLISGGERQRIAIARAILKNAPILILDEATSSLDSESERAVQAALEELMQGRTTICIAHRLSTIQKANRIIVLDGGRIVESGTHDELIKARGIYCRLYELQFKPATA
jgi:ATP-binding cassette, subfamily B, bacterial MsbA